MNTQDVINLGSVPDFSRNVWCITEQEYPVRRPVSAVAATAVRKEINYEWK
jgi:hypothetical protein